MFHRPGRLGSEPIDKLRALSCRIKILLLSLKAAMTLRGAATRATCVQHSTVLLDLNFLLFALSHGIATMIRAAKNMKDHTAFEESQMI